MQLHICMYLQDTDLIRIKYYTTSSCAVVQLRFHRFMQTCESGQCLKLFIHIHMGKVFLK